MQPDVRTEPEISPNQGPSGSGMAKTHPKGGAVRDPPFWMVHTRYTFVFGGPGPLVACRTPLGLKPTPVSRLGFSHPLACARASAMSPPTADQPTAITALQPAPCLASPIGDPHLILAVGTCTVHDSPVVAPWAKWVCFAVALAGLVGHVGFAVPPTLQPFDVLRSRQ